MSEIDNMVMQLWLLKQSKVGHQKIPLFVSDLHPCQKILQKSSVIFAMLAKEFYRGYFILPYQGFTVVYENFGWNWHACNRTVIFQSNQAHNFENPLLHGQHLFTDKARLIKQLFIKKENILKNHSLAFVNITEGLAM